MAISLKTPQVVPQYNHANGCWEFIECIDEHLRELLTAQLGEVSAVGLITDESTDISVKPQLVLLVRFVRQGQLWTHLLGLRELTDKTANGISDVIKLVLQEYSLPTDKLYGFCSDGASVMTGTTNGVVKQLKDLAPRMLAFHCVAHRVPLASEGLHELPAVSRVEELLASIVAFFNRSTKRYQHLHFWCSETEAAVKLPRLHEVRWLSEHNSLCNVLRMIHALLECFKEEADTGSEQVTFTCSTCLVACIACLNSLLSVLIAR